MADATEPERFACKHCRRVLFTSDDLMEHAPERHQIAARRKLKDARTMQQQTKNGVLYVDGCASYFLQEQLPWMDEDALAEGKLKCPNEKCQSRLGSFDWAGSQCSCGTWVTPSIKLTKSRVDLILKANAVPIVSTIMHIPTPHADAHEKHEETTTEHTPQPSVDDKSKPTVTVDDLALDD